MKLLTDIRTYLTLGFSILFFAGLGRIPLMEPDEGRYLEIPREMILTGDYVLPHLNGVLYFEKPPLYYWLNVLSIRIWGLNEFGARFWNALFGLLGLGIAWFLGKSMKGEKTGLYSVLILGTTPLYFLLSRINIIDMALSFFLNLALLFFWIGCQNPERSGKKLAWNLMFIFCGMAVMTKGLIGMVLPGAIIVLFMIITGKWNLLKDMPFITGILLFLCIVLPWHILAARRNEDFLYFYLVREHFLRYATSIAKRQEPLWFFFPVIMIGFLPWSCLFFSAAGTLKKISFDSIRENTGNLFLSLWAGIIFLFFSLSQSKLIPYILPAVLPFSILLAGAFNRITKKMKWDKPSRIGIGFSSLFVLLFGMAGSYAGSGQLKNYPGFDVFSPVLFLLGFLIAVLSLWILIRHAAWQPEKWLFINFILSLFLLIMALNAAMPIAEARTSKAFTEQLKTIVKEEDELYGFHYYPQSYPVYRGQLIDLAGFRGELEFGISKLTREERTKRFPFIREFKKIWNSEKRIFLIVKDTWLSHLKKEGFSHYKIHCQKNSLYLISNH
ncbi:MAG: glycosyltransferase family 39 protein [Candidatus Aureabacteria bacterium]|nr:glycosyltransferase family 39 protein [Candidatus Auribacterota bacterium]